jgi:hypothetical protein
MSDQLLQFIVVFRRDAAGDLRDVLKRLARAEQRSQVSLLRSMILEGVRARLHRLPTIS